MRDGPSGIAGPESALPGPVSALPGTVSGPGGTGDVSVDVALERLATLGTRPVTEHVGEYEVVHRALQEALAAIDQG